MQDAGTLRLTVRLRMWLIYPALPLIFALYFIGWESAAKRVINLLARASTVVRRA